MADTAQIEALQAQLERWRFVPSLREPWSAKHVASAEAGVGRALPVDFRWFVLTHGSGHLPSPGPVVDLADGRIQQLGGLGGGFDRYPDGRYRQPIGSVPGLISCAWRFYLRLDGEHGEAVWFTEEEAIPLRDGDFVKAANSFTDLLASSRPHVPGED